MGSYTWWYTRRREENTYRLEHANRYGRMAVEWLSWETARTGHFIRHQTNGSEKRVGKLLVDETRKNTAYLREFVEVVEMWECEWKRIRKDAEVKEFIKATCPRRREPWELSQAEIASAIRAGTLFGLVECDIHVPSGLRDYFAEMQPVFKNIDLTREDICPFMQRYAEEHDIMKRPQRTLVGSYRGDNIMYPSQVVHATRASCHPRVPGDRTRAETLLSCVR
ncbi:hypothetical protein NP493_16g12081 [Ridgeia piscesae]|uniref:Uncharacterized protein n=1 Tax=Ridgeia piscesae TaxID=27915 RepID=A0AAD9PEZ7_RIDPI|nr:hypothetical protein NP493_16g12081 [Ridgeia piscesae]